MRSSLRKPCPRWTRRKEARPGEIVSAALDLFVERGYKATRLEDVARRAGVSKGTLYLYFPNKEELFKAVVREALVPNLERAEQLVEQHRGSAADLIRDLVEGWWGAIGQTRLSGIPKLVLAESGNFPELARFYLEEVVQRGHRLFARALERGMGSGEFRKLEVQYALRILIAPLVLALLWKHSLGLYEKKPMDMTQYLRALVDIMLHGLLA